MNVNPAHLAAIIALDELNDISLTLLAMAVERGDDPRGLPGYDQVSYLFTHDVDGVPHVHDVTREAFGMAVAERAAALGVVPDAAV